MQPFEIQIRSQAGQVNTLTVTEIVSIDGKPYNGSQQEDVQACFQAIRHLEGRIEQINDTLNTLLGALSNG